MRRPTGRCTRNGRTSRRHRPRWRWRRRRPDPEQIRRSRRRRRIRQRHRLSRVLRVGPVRNQRIGQLLQLVHVRRLRLGRHGREVGIRLVGTRRRRPILCDLAALLPVPPVDRVHRGGRRTTGQQPSSRHQQAHRHQHGRDPSCALPGFLRTTSLRACFTDHHMPVPLSATGGLCSRWCRRRKGCLHGSKRQERRKRPRLPLGH